MIDRGAQLFAYINQIRASQCLDPREYLWTQGAEPGDPERCILAQALNCAVGVSEDPQWHRDERWVMSFRLVSPARRVVQETGWDSRMEYLEVALPPVLAEFATSYDDGRITTDVNGFVTSWLVATDEIDPLGGRRRYWLPGMRRTPAAKAA